jgi:hypothetical protein
VTCVNEIGVEVIKHRKILDLEVGKCFGEDFICFNSNNSYSVKVESPVCILRSIKKEEFSKKYKRMLQPLQKYFSKRHRLIAQIVEDGTEQEEEIKKNFYSTIEKGQIGVYLMRELKMQLDHANVSMKKKLYRHYLKRDMDMQSQKANFT